MGDVAMLCGRGAASGQRGSQSTARGACDSCLVCMWLSLQCDSTNDSSRLVRLIHTDLRNFGVSRDTNEARFDLILALF